VLNENPDKKKKEKETVSRILQAATTGFDLA